MTVTFTDTPEITGEGSIRKVDADNPTKGIAGAVIKITGVDNDFTGTYVTGAGGYLTDVPWKDMPLGSYTAEEVTPPEGYTKSPDVNKTKQTFVWDGKTDVALVFENDAKVKVRLIKLDDSGNPLPGAVFNIVRDGQIIGTEETKADGSITVTDVTEGMYAFVEVSVPAPWATLTEPVIAHVDQATVNGGGTVTVTASDKRLPSLTILKRDAQTGDVIPNTHFEIRGIHYGYHNDVTTGPDGRAVLSNIPVDSYEVTEKSVPDPYVVGDEPTQTIWLGAGDSKELVFDNLKQPVLKISKVEQGSNTPIQGRPPSWADVFAVFAAKTAGAADGESVAVLDTDTVEKLRTVFWDMTKITTETKTVDHPATDDTDAWTETVLVITVTPRTTDDMRVFYDFTEEQNAALDELLTAESRDLWSSLLYGNSGEFVAVALTQVGNVGGQPYWSWYGFNSRVEWCACFVSWCANECGYIDTGVIPKFAGCTGGSNWFKNRGQWQDGSYEPHPGDLIFFDWNEKGGSGPQDDVPDHVGIVERVENGVVYTVEGNSGDSCRQRSYSVGHYEIWGYATPVYNE